MNDDRIERLERAIAVLANDRLRAVPICHCGGIATYYDPKTLGHRDLCKAHGSPVQTAVERVDAHLTNTLTAFLKGLESAKTD